MVAGAAEGGAAVEDDDASAGVETTLSLVISAMVNGEM